MTITDVLRMDGWIPDVHAQVPSWPDAFAHAVMPIEALGRFGGNRVGVLSFWAVLLFPGCDLVGTSRD